MTIIGFHMLTYRAGLHGYSHLVTIYLGNYRQSIFGPEGYFSDRTIHKYQCSLQFKQPGNFTFSCLEKVRSQSQLYMESTLLCINQSEDMKNHFRAIDVYSLQTAHMYKYLWSSQIHSEAKLGSIGTPNGLLTPSDRSEMQRKVL